MKDKKISIQLSWVLIPFAFAILIGITVRPEKLSAAMRGAQNGLASGSAEQAAQDLAFVARFQPWRSGLWELAAQTALDSHHPEKAIEYIQAAIERNNISPPGYLILGDAYLAQGNQNSALENWHRASELGADPIAVNERSYKVYIAQGEYLGALNHLLALNELDPEDAEIQYQLGLALAAREPEMACHIYKLPLSSTQPYANRQAM